MQIQKDIGPIVSLLSLSTTLNSILVLGLLPSIQITWTEVKPNYVMLGSIWKINCFWSINLRINWLL